MSNVTSADLLVEMEKSRQSGEITETLGKMIMWIAHRYAFPPNIEIYDYELHQEMEEHAILMMVKVYVNFDPEKSDNPFAYLVQVTKCAFANIRNKEAKEKGIKDEYQASYSS